jgi:hypothetical protein
LKLYTEFQEKQESKGPFQDYLYKMRMQEYDNMQKGKVDAVFRIKSEQVLMRALLWRKRRLPYCIDSKSNSK